MQPVGNLQQSIVGKCFADERYAEGQAIGLETRRHRDCCQIKQIDEVGVIAEIAIQLNRRLLKLSDGVVGGRSGQQKEVDLLEDLRGFAAQLLQCIVPIEG